MKRTTMALVLALGLAGCASVPVILQIASYAISAMDIALSAAQTFAETNVSDPAKRKQVLDDIVQARAAEAAFQTLVNAGAALNDRDVTEALADFAVAWNDVEALLKSFGVLTMAPSARYGASPLAGRLILPSADALMPKGADTAAVHAGTSAKMEARAAQALRSPGAGKPTEGPRSGLTVAGDLDTIPAIFCLNGTTLQERFGEWDCYPPPKYSAITLRDGESLMPWRPVAAFHEDGTIESAWLPQWLAVPIAMGLATR